MLLFSSTFLTLSDGKRFFEHSKLTKEVVVRVPVSTFYSYAVQGCSVITKGDRMCRDMTEHKLC